MKCTICGKDCNGRINIHKDIFTRNFTEKDYFSICNFCFQLWASGDKEELITRSLKKMENINNHSQ